MYVADSDEEDEDDEDAEVDDNKIPRGYKTASTDCTECVRKNVECWESTVANRKQCYGCTALKRKCSHVGAVGAGTAGEAWSTVERYGIDRLIQGVQGISRAKDDSLRLVNGPGKEDCEFTLVILEPDSPLTYGVDVDLSYVAMVERLPRYIPAILSDVSALRDNQLELVDALEDVAKSFQSHTGGLVDLQTQITALTSKVRNARKEAEKNRVAQALQNQEILTKLDQILAGMSEPPADTSGFTIAKYTEPVPVTPQHQQARPFGPAPLTPQRHTLQSAQPLPAASSSQLGPPSAPARVGGSSNAKSPNAPTSTGKRNVNAALGVSKGPAMDIDQGVMDQPSLGEEGAAARAESNAEDEDVVPGVPKGTLKGIHRSYHLDGPFSQMSKLSSVGDNEEGGSNEEGESNDQAGEVDQAGPAESAEERKVRKGKSVARVEASTRILRRRAGEL